MRLLERLPNGDLTISSFNDDHPPPYAILSHTWTEGQEVAYNELGTGTGKAKAGYAKLLFCVKRAAEDGLQFCWVDTCSIDKSSSTELSTAINSMFRWYQRAARCYVYLSDVQVPDEITNAQASDLTWKTAFRRSRWFTRGWTLQELLAPASVEFFSMEGRRLGNRTSLEAEIYSVTGIPLEVLRGGSHTDYSMNERMRWAEARTTTVKEDKAYCLLGIFGVFMPLIYGEGETYAMIRLREEIQKRQEGDRTDAPLDLAISSSLPFPRNELFVGRESELQSLERFFLSDSCQRMTIHGLGGCGKSAVVLEFAYRVLARYTRPLVFWVPAISQESFELAYQEIGLSLHVLGIGERNADNMQLVKRSLESESASQWLMIVDNADDPGVLMGDGRGTPRSTRLLDYIPHSSKGKIVFTTRSRKVAGNLTQNNILELNDISKAQARQLLSQRLSKPALLDNQMAVDKLLERLTYLPLAIVQAAAFMHQNDMSVSAYSSLFQTAGTEAELFGEHFEDSSRYRELESTIAKTWHISFDQIRRQDSTAAEYLSFMACIDRINIPESLLPSIGSSVQTAKALGTLKGYAFIAERQQTTQEAESEKLFDMHRLVHMASEWWLEVHNERATWITKVAARLEELIPYGGHEKMGVWTMYLPHAIHTSRLNAEIDEVTKVALLSRIGRCQESLGKYQAAETTEQQVVRLRERILGTEHPYTLTSMNNLALLLERLGRYEEAESTNRQTLARYKKVFGVEHPHTLSSRSNLALILGSQGKYKEAELINRQTLARRKEVLGVEHLDTLISMANLAGVLGSQGKYLEAESMNRQTLARYKKVLGPEHPNTLTTMSNLALMLGSQKKYKEAELMNRQILRLYEKVLGIAHPNTLASLSNLALILGSQGKYEEAEIINRQVLRDYEKSLGLEHPYTLMSVYCLARLLADRHCFDESTVQYERACAGYSSTLGEDHPNTRACQGDYRRMLASQGQDRLQLPQRSQHRHAGSTTDYMPRLVRGLIKWA